MAAARPGPGEGFYPGIAPIDSYGRGGFRFAGMSHQGSLLLTPDGIAAWPVEDIALAGPADLQPILAAAGKVELVLLGLGAEPRLLPADLARTLDAAGLGWDAMSTGAACRTYNILLAEGRRLAAAMIAVS